MNDLDAGQTVEVIVHVPHNPAIMDYFKWDDGAQEWLSVAPRISHVPAGSPNKTRIRFSLTDGDRFDQDGTANGRIVDPGGPVTIATQIPVLPGWAIMLLAVLLGLMGLGYRSSLWPRRQS
ncbi:MAG: choice-of-anchor U domain-containing protein [Halioglobus sp.]|nr:choice-of-anchor U domain-containing protein [Halioglobus sp.]